MSPLTLEILRHADTAWGVVEAWSHGNPETPWATTTEYLARRGLLERTQGSAIVPSRQLNLALEGADSTPRPQAVARYTLTKLGRDTLYNSPEMKRVPSR